MLLVGSSATNVIGSASPDPDNSPKRRQLLRIFSQCHQQKGLIQLRSQAWKGGEDSPQLLLWNSRKLPRLLFQNCEPCHTRENLWLQGGKPYTHPLTWLPRSRCLWSERCRMRPSCVMQRLLNLEQMMVGPKWMVMLYIGKSQYTYIHIYIYTYIHIYIYTYIHIHTYTHTHISIVFHHFSISFP